jgi:3',5'-cyclic AMP phosphodiesterase CpdA
VKFGASFALSSALFPASTNYLKAVKDHGKIQENRNPANARILGSSILPSAPRQKHGKRQKLETRSTRQEYRISSNRLIRPSSAVARISREFRGEAIALAAQAQQVTLPLEKGSVRFAVIGDSGTGGRLQYETAQQLERTEQKFSFEFILMMGDNLYGSKTPRDFESKFEVPYKPLLDSGIKFYASLGNHDIPDEQSYKPFNMDGHRYYSFKKGRVRFFALDSNYMDPDQLKWLENQLQAATEDWKIAFFHHPLYSSGAKHGSATELRGLLEPLFVKYGVRIVFSGHDHVYERIQPQKGIYYFTEGSSGQLRRGDARGASFTAKAFDEGCAFMVIEVTPDEATFRTISRAGVTVDSGMIQRSASQPQGTAGHHP